MVQPYAKDTYFSNKITMALLKNKVAHFVWNYFGRFFLLDQVNFNETLSVELLTIFLFDPDEILFLIAFSILLTRSSNETFFYEFFKNQKEGKNIFQVCLFSSFEMHNFIFPSFNFHKIYPSHLKNWNNFKKNCSINSRFFSLSFSFDSAFGAFFLFFMHLYLLVLLLLFQVQKIFIEHLSIIFLRVSRVLMIYIFND